jgi:hypothetical protein
MSWKDLGQLQDALRAAAADILGPLDQIDPNVVLWGLLLLIIVFVAHSADQYVRQRAAVLAVMKQFGERFVREFERPLIQPGAAGRPIHARLHFAPDRERLDVLLAPGRGRRYPNLSDHRNNLEYDLTRVLASLRGQPFVTGRPYAHGPWVVVPFQLTHGSTKAGTR